MRKTLILLAFLLISLNSKAYDVEKHLSEYDTMTNNVGYWNVYCAENINKKDIMFETKLCGVSSYIEGVYDSFAPLSFNSEGFKLDFAGALQIDKIFLDPKTRFGIASMMQSVRTNIKIRNRILDNITNYDVSISTNKTITPFKAKAIDVIKTKEHIDSFIEDNLMNNNLLLEAFVDANTAKVVFASKDGAEKYEYNYSIVGLREALNEIDPTRDPFTFGERANGFRSGFVYNGSQVRKIIGLEDNQ